MKSKKIVITGAEGFIATNLILKLSNIKGFKLVGLDSSVANSSNTKFTNNKIIHNQINITSSDKVFDLIQGSDVVVHLAARGNVIESISDPIENFKSNIFSTLMLLESMRKADVKNIVFASTGGALMGNTPPPVNEKSLPSPISPYGASKLCCEGYLSAYAHSFGINSISLRFGNVYGKFSSHKKGVINKWIRKSIMNDCVDIYGDGKSTRDYIHVDDICDGIIASIHRIISNQKLTCEKYHLANNQEISLTELSDIIEISSKKKLIRNFKKLREGEVFRNCSEYDLAKRILNFEPKRKFEKEIPDLYDWIKEYEF
jgi:UDP-glucose 4-epimerase